MTRALIIPVVLMTLFTSCKQKKEEWVSPIEAPVTEAVFAAGHIEADEQFTLTAVNDGYIKEIAVEAGDTVNSNQTLFIQDNTTAAIQQQTAAENLHITQQQAMPGSAVLEQLQAQLNSATDKLENDKAQWERMQRLFAGNSVAKIEADNAELAYNNSLNNVLSINKNIEATKQNLQQAVVNSRGQQQTAAANKDYFNIKSPGNYKVFTVLKKKGEMLRKGEAVAILGKPENLKIVLNIDEASIAKIQMQQKVLIELNTQKGKTYKGHVSKIYPAFDVANQAYTVEASFDTVEKSIINGTLLQANIIVGAKEKAMLIPRNCLTADNRVVLKNNNGTDTVPVKAGIVSNEWVEVIAGLKASDKIMQQ